MYRLKFITKNAWNLFFYSEKKKNTLSLNFVVVVVVVLLLLFTGVNIAVDKCRLLAIDIEACSPREATLS